MTLKYLSLFSGIGGFELGIEKAQIDAELIGHSEVDNYAKSVYSRWFPKSKCWGDATQIDTRDLPKFDLLVGGFPCQAFSIAGKRKGFDDSRGTLFYEIARILNDKEPKYFVLENVHGLLSHRGGETFHTMLGILSELGYDVEWQSLNSKDFGLAQNRERIYIKGYSRRKCRGEILSQQRGSRETISRMNWSWTSTRVSKFVDTDGLSLTLCSDGHNSGRNQLIRVKDNSHGQRVYDSDGLASSLCGNGGGQGGKTGLYKIDLLNGTADGNVATIDASYYKGISPADVKNTTRKRTHIVENPLKVKTSTKQGYDEANIHDGVRLDHPNRTTGRGAVQKEKSGAISTGCDWGTVDKDYRIRRLTPVECERLQGFPDNYTKYGKDGELISDTQRYKMLGNAVSTNVVEYIMRCMFSEKYGLDNEE